MIQGHADVFSDYASISVPSDRFPEVSQGLLPVLDVVGASCVSPGLYRLDTGTVKVVPRGAVHVISATGRVLAALRAAQLLDTYLMAFADGPHRVTRVDAAMDFPGYGPDYVKAAYQLADNGKLRLSRKRVAPKKFWSPVLYEGGAARETGSTYLGGRKAEVSAVIYDKRQESIERYGVDIGENRTRAELRVRSGMRPSLRDISSPLPMFYHFMAPDIVYGFDAPEWVPSGFGFPVQRQEILPYERMKRLVQDSSDIGRALAAAEACGPEGLSLLIALIRRRAAQSGSCVLGLAHVV